MKIFKASAGSGKTFQLTFEYLKVVIQRPYDFKNILAVTFTNKATEEMKGRILEELYLLSKDKESKHLENLTSTLHLTEQEVRANAAQALKLILFNYSSFNVYTIDRFFQRILKAFAWESGIYDSINLELDSSKILNDSVQYLYDTLEENKELKKWLTDYSTEEITSGASFNLKKKIEKMGEQLFREDVQADIKLLELMKDANFSLSKFKAELYQSIGNFEDTLAKYGKKGLQIIESAGLDLSDFKGGQKSFANTFKKWVNQKYDLTKATISALDDPESWYTKTQRDDLKVSIANVRDNGLLSLLQEGVEYIHSKSSDYYSAKAILGNINALGILYDLSKAIQEVSKNKEILLLSNTNQIIHKLIDESHSPFIYEKTGQRINHIMIDEFQDTSLLQWANFKPLILESLSEGHMVTLVGDVKQSIYRWRNGDWGLLNQRVAEEIKDYPLDARSLTENWRSNPFIIRFNSILFSLLPKDIEEFYNKDIEEDEFIEFDLPGIYSDYEQNFPSIKKGDNTGYVEVNYYNDPKNEWKEKAKQNLIQNIKDLQDQNYQADQIAILTRSSDEGREVVNLLIEQKNNHPKDGYNYEVISTDALRLNNSPTVNFIIDTLKHLKYPNQIEHRLAMLNFLAKKQDLLLENCIEGIHEENFLIYAGDYNMTELGSKIKYLPPIATINELISYFLLTEDKTELIFLDTFKDWVQEMGQFQVLSNEKLIDLWSEQGSKININTPEGGNAIQVLTIHKSKGMEFDALIIPFCDWDLDYKPIHQPTLWCETKDTPFQSIPIVPIRYKKDLLQSRFRSDFLREKKQIFVDNLNLLYVALTRAKSALFIHIPTSSSNTISSFILKAIDQLKVDWESFSETETKTSWGELIPEPKESKAKLNYKTEHSLEEPKQIPLIFKNSYTEVYNSDSMKTQREEGLVYHRILSKIYVPMDAIKVIEEEIQEGLISREEGETFLVWFNKSMESETIANWFSKENSIKTESSILIMPGKTKRPDRIVSTGEETLVIDFKTGQKRDAHKRQLLEYVHLIQEMNYPNPKGIIWYLTDNEIVNCN